MHVAWFIFNCVRYGFSPLLIYNIHMYYISVFLAVVSSALSLIFFHLRPASPASLIFPICLRTCYMRSTEDGVGGNKMRECRRCTGKTAVRLVIRNVRQSWLLALKRDDWMGEDFHDILQKIILKRNVRDYDNIIILRYDTRIENWEYKYNIINIVA